MTIKTTYSINISLTEKEKSAIGLVQEFIETINVFIVDKGGYSFKDFLENFYGGDIVDFLIDFELHTEAIQKKIGKYLNPQEGER